MRSKPVRPETAYETPRVLTKNKARLNSIMKRHVRGPSIVEAAGNLPKRIEEFFGRVNTDSEEVSIARMRSPEGWEEPGQRPDFDEYTLVIDGILHVEFEDEAIDVRAGEAVVARAGEWVRYSTPHPGGAGYVAVCVPAFSLDTVHRDE